MAYVVGFGYFRQRFPVTLPGQSFVTLMLVQLRPPTELDPIGLCTLPALIRPRQDQVTLELSRITQPRVIISLRYGVCAIVGGYCTSPFPFGNAQWILNKVLDEFEGTV